MRNAASKNAGVMLKNADDADNADERGQQLCGRLLTKHLVGR